MNPLLRKLVNHKLNNLTEIELIKLAKGYDINLTKEQSRKTLKILNKELIDIGNKDHIDRLLKQIGKEINKDTERKLRYLFSVFN